MATRVAAAAAIALATSYVIATQLRKKSKIKKLSNAFQGKVRLPTSVTPSRYDLELTPKLDTCKFDGKMTVNVNIVEETKYIVLNAADLNIVDKTVWLRSKTSRQVSVVRITQWSILSAAKYFCQPLMFLFVVEFCTMGARL